ncbi:MAG: HPr family phosphocarrier protein [Desulfobacteraceae bacterium]
MSGLLECMMERIKVFRISNELGLHARSAAKLVELAGKYNAGLYLSRDGNEVDGGSILSILSLACPKGTEITVRAVGEQADDLMAEVGRLFESKFGEPR